MYWILDGGSESITSTSIPFRTFPRRRSRNYCKNVVEMDSRKLHIHLEHVSIGPSRSSRSSLLPFLHSIPTTYYNGLGAEIRIGSCSVAKIHPLDVHPFLGFSS